MHPEASRAAGRDFSGDIVKISAVAADGGQVRHLHGQVQRQPRPSSDDEQGLTQCKARLG